MISTQTPIIHHVAAVACVVLVSLVAHGALVLGGVSGPSLERSDAPHVSRIALPSNLR